MTWDDADLEARLCRALDLATKTIRSFAVTGFIDTHTPELSFGAEKPIAETAMLLYAASGAGPRPCVTTRVDAVAQLLVPFARSERVVLNVVLSPALSQKFAVPHVLLTRLGYPDPSFDALLQDAFAASVANGHERSPTAELERNWIWKLWTGAETDRSGHELMANSLLNWPLDILRGLREDAYALTHLLFYCTDFGASDRSPPRPPSVILNEASALLARYLDSEDYDLSGEILMAWPLLGASWDPSAAFAFRVLASVENQAGLLPCGNVSHQRLGELTGQERARYALGTAYHTAYVMGFLCAASLRPGRAPPHGIVGPSFERSLLTTLQQYTMNDQGHWQNEFASLAAAEQHALVPFIFDLAVVQNSRKRDYDAVSRLIRLACKHGIADRPICSQAAEMLERLTRASSLIGVSAAERRSTKSDIGVDLGAFD